MEVWSLCSPQRADVPHEAEVVEVGGEGVMGHHSSSHQFHWSSHDRGRGQDRQTEGGLQHRGSIRGFIVLSSSFHILFHGWPRRLLLPIQFYMYLYELVINSKKNEPFCFEVRVRLSVLCIYSQPTLKRLMLVLVYLKLFSD